MQIRVHELTIEPVQPAKEPVSKEAHPDDELMNLLEDYESSFRRGEIKEGIVVSVNDKDVVVDIGVKSNGVIPLGEFEYTGIPEVNSHIMVFINDLDNGEGRLSLSKRKADFIKRIELIKQAAIDGTILTGTIRRRVKGGMIVNVIGIEAFLPGSQMSLKPIPNLDQFIGKELQFKVMNIDEEHRNIILSRKMVLEEEASVKRQELLSRIQVDTELDGEVKNITQYGAFIDLGGIDGLLHLTDMSWGKINHPTDMLSIGDKVKVKVIKFDPETNKISLGLKQLVPPPWEEEYYKRSSFGKFAEKNSSKLMESHQQAKKHANSSLQGIEEAVTEPDQEISDASSDPNKTPDHNAIPDIKDPFDPNANRF